LLTLAFSTVNKNLLQLLTRLKEQSFPEWIDIIIINQIFDDIDSSIVEDGKIRVYHFHERGISRSRNRALELSVTKFVWFLDDDVTIDVSKFSQLHDLLETFNSTAFIVNIGSLEDDKAFYKDYSKRPYGAVVKNKLHLLRVSSIEIIVNRDLILRKKIYFDEELGLGTTYPCCEENKFLMDIYNQFGTICFYDITPIRHTTKLDGRLAVSKGHYLARGYIAKLFPLYIRILLILRWAMRRNEHYGFLSRCCLLFNGIPERK
jgi:glycosyltransferase involved in cell wall biosynthesis